MQQVRRLRFDRLPAAYCALAFLAWAPAAGAGEFASPEAVPEDCLARASLMVNPGEALVIELFDGQRIDGKLVSFDLEQRLVNLERWDEFGASTRQVAADGIRRYEYSERSGKAAAGSGAIVGAVAGAVAGVAMTPNGDGFDRLQGAIAGAAVGGGVGYMVGESLGSGDRPAGAVICGE
ncbi:MAG: hypothetical protein IPO18_04720 [bacterium]|nr:hypothetical protein [bacterium]